MRSHAMLAAVLLQGVATSATGNASCTFYSNKSTNCDGGCGSCFNPGARSGKLCSGGGGQVGYYCPSDVGGEGDITFACMDWSFGSSAMKKAEEAFNSRAGEDVYFGIGTYGTGSDPQRGLAACYRLTVSGLDRDIIAQSVNTGSDVAGNQFDLQQGAGGAGEYNNCAGKPQSMYPGSTDAWGCVYGGIATRAACSGLPEYPQNSSGMKAAGDSLIELCQYAFDKKIRFEGAGGGDCGGNPTLTDATRVKCPEELVQMTWAQRSDDPATYKHTDLHRQAGFPNVDNVCSGGGAYCLTRMMDCRKPSGAFKDNMQAGLMVQGRKLVQTCASDGYLRHDVQCGCLDCYC